ncbi:MAG TPA: B-box zinc finger protein [Candidatus Hydrogenedentes bacterium]|nr:B-box zinc finger protein [Candidatus Hydrogenedentota bacterium]HPU96897.1 B-box zinc finger protein [Candidatus Hydrogenedentota bacterium]
MLEVGTAGSCVNHPAAPAVYRCKQCGAAVCKVCVVQGPGGWYCSDACRERHEKFIGETRTYSDVKGRKTGLGIVHRITRLLGSLIVLAVTALAIGVIASLVEVPIISGITRTVRGFIGI